MKSHHIAAEEAFKDLFPPGKNRKNVVTGKRCVVKKGDFQVGTLLPNEAWSQPEVVIVNPDRCPLSGFSTGGIGETSIDNFKNFPISVIDVEMGWEGVQYWPETFLGSDVIKA